MNRRFFCILRDLIFAIVKDWFFLLGINFWDFREVAFNGNQFSLNCVQLTSETTCGDVKHINPVTSVILPQLHRAFVWLIAATRLYL